MRREQFTVGELLRSGVSDGAGRQVKETNDSNLKVHVECATGSIPSAATGYAVGCVLIDTTTGKIYTNQGSTTSCTFNSIGDITSAELADSIDLGSSGAAGDLDIFPTTASMGKLAISATDNAGNTTTTITNAEQAAARTYTIPDAGASASFAMTEGAQTLGGVKTFTSPIVYDANTTITAFATGGQASATALTGEFNNVTTCATAFDSVKLPAAVAGQTVTIKNSGAATLSVFPSTDDTINALAANLSVDIPVNGEVTFRAISATAWETAETLYLSSPTTQTGGLAIAAAASAGNTITTITNATQAAARTYTIPDAGASAEFVMNAGAQSIAGVKTFTDGIVCEDGELKLGAGAGTAITATAAEINAQCDISGIGQTITVSGAVTAGKKSVLLNHDSAAIVSTIADASLHAGWFVVKAGLEPAGGQDHTCTITTGTWDGTNKVATFADINDALVIFFDHVGNGTIISNTGAVAMS